MINDEKGVAIVEFVIVLPFLVMLLLGIIEFSNFIYQLNQLNQRVFTGLRYSSKLYNPLFPIDQNQITNLIVCNRVSICQADAYRLHTIKISEDSKLIKIDVVKQYTPILGLISSNLKSNQMIIKI